MSFDTLKVKDLKALAADFAVDVDGLKNKADIIASLSEEGVTWSVYQGTLKNIENAKEDSDEILPRLDPNQKLDEDMVLVRMDRPNYRYDALGFTFTIEHPFVAMKPEVAQQIFDKEEGFRLATPREVQEYYN
jgi:hypothetical protein